MTITHLPHAPVDYHLLYHGNSKIYPKGASYNVNEKGTIVKGSNIIKYFQKLGWGWGGNWKYSKDYQHFSSNGR